MVQTDGQLVPAFMGARQNVPAAHAKFALVTLKVTEQPTTAAATWRSGHFCLYGYDIMRGMYRKNYM